MAKRMPSTDIASFQEYIKSSTRIIALLGAGLSASSGLPTFRGAGGLWRSYDATELATPEAFEANPDLVWQFYSYRRHMALNAKPNKAHYALAELSRRKEHFVTLSQNVDGLSQRAGHERGLCLLHGNLFTVKCTSFYCNYVRENELQDPIVPALAIPRGFGDKTGEEASKVLSETLDKAEEEKQDAEAEEEQELDISDERIPLNPIPREELPQCPECKEGLLRPGVVWFGEALPSQTLDYVDNWMDEGKIDLMLVIGTSSKVWPAAGYVEQARGKGARIAVVNMDPNDMGKGKFTSEDWFFQGDASVIVPEMLKGVIGEI
ncbi:SIR2 family NAD-dependent protein deacylase [Aspergillus stella-maris]|uniref:SIR2 family NAD-dependent protein deacylase n=1 Tax=Aspergillus stella-maris TaxID=1810926 RepID=UPI003CCDD8AB